MDYEEYRRRYFADPPPPERFEAQGILGATLYYQDYQGALAFLRQVFGDPVYVEGENTHGWRIGRSWLSVFPAKEGAPINIEIPLYLQRAADVDQLYAAFIEAGASGDEPQNTLIYEPVRMAIVTDPFGATWDLVARI